jgi:hypothetical protein
MEPVRIDYRIRLESGRTESFKFILDGERFDLIPGKVKNPPDWTRLGHRQCKHCTLDEKAHPHCPLALQLHGLVTRFEETSSIDEVVLDVVTEDRRVIQKVALQQAIASMLDLIWPICGCPKTTNMKPLARFHLPVASEEETVFRVTGMYLLGQYFRSHNSDSAAIEFDGLAKIYEDYHILNKALASRLQEVTRSDSVKNAITLLDMYSMLVPALLEDQLAEMRPFFEAYAPQGGELKETSDHLKKAKAFRLELVPMAAPPVNKMDNLEAALASEEPGLSMGSEGEESRLAKEQARAKIREQATSEARAREKQAAEEILSGSSLSLELEPLDESATKPKHKDEIFEMAEEEGANTENNAWNPDVKDAILKLEDQ